MLLVLVVEKPNGLQTAVTSHHSSASVSRSPSHRRALMSSPPKTARDLAE